MLNVIFLQEFIMQHYTNTVCFAGTLTFPLRVVIKLRYLFL